MRTFPLPLVLLVTLAAITALSGCVTMTRGTHEDITVESMPSGAAIYVDGEKVGDTPGVVSVTRDSKHAITLRLDGYSDDTTVLQRQVNKSTSMSPLLGAVGIVSGAVDTMTGSAYHMVPDHVFAELTPEGTAGSFSYDQATASATGVPTESTVAMPQ